MAFWNLFVVALMPVLETLLVTLLGALMATERFNFLRGVEAKNCLNSLVFYVFTPALLIAELAKTITFDQLVEMWFMVVNILLTFIVGSVLGWMLNKMARTPKHLRGLVSGCCAAGNLGNLPIIIVPAVCKESDSPFGDTSTCSTYGEAYASISMGVSSLLTFSYLYILMESSVDRDTQNMNTIDATTSTTHFTTTPEIFPANVKEPLLPSTNFSSTDNLSIQHESPHDKNESKVSILNHITWPITKCFGYVKMEKLFTPITIAGIIGFTIGAVTPMQNLMVGDSAPLRVIINSASLVGEGAIVSMTLIVGANLLDGLKKSGISVSLIMGIMGVRFIISPILGILIVKVAHYWGFVGSYSLYQFVLMLQYALPPATAIGTIAQLLGIVESECSFIMIWTYTAATFSLTLWCTLFMWMLE
ncbi:protein PIN-LIKES 3-like [Lotus japonicus]|uniref:protein PIN-LIKES 3-like n=1 Tax=Lotus japonicus TaxID=34305 RepID=UPI002585B746|nr:protein PIN-LIKES 3-like [Lotus japonicus]XP_057421442.1 protein PIN-LIKES 3-like [Lotus japonicus]